MRHVQAQCLYSWPYSISSKYDSVSIGIHADTIQDLESVEPHLEGLADALKDAVQ